MLATRDEPTMASGGRSEVKMTPQCYGRMFPSLDSREADAGRKGHVFGLKVHTLGIGSTGVDILVDAQQWERCTACTAYRTCYDLSMARFHLAQVAV